MNTKVIYNERDSEDIIRVVVHDQSQSIRMEAR